MDTAERVLHANAVIEAISAHGRRFFHDDRGPGHFIMSGDKVCYVDHYSRKEVVTDEYGRWNGFTNGSTLRGIIYGLSEFIRTGKPMSHWHFGPWEEYRLHRGLWGYGEGEMQKVRAAIIDNPAINAPAIAPTIFKRLEVLLPEIRAAEIAYDADMAKAEKSTHIERAAKKFNAVLVKAFDAAAADTSKVNSITSMRQVYEPQTKYALWFNSISNTSKFLTNVVKYSSFNGEYPDRLERAIATWEAARQSNDPTPALRFG